MKNENQIDLKEIFDSECIALPSKNQQQDFERSFIPQTGMLIRWKTMEAGEKA